MKTSSTDRLLMIVSAFPPLNEAGVFRTLRFARYLPSLDWDVHVLTLSEGCYEASATIDQALLDKLPESIQVHRTMAIQPMEWWGRVRRTFQAVGQVSNRSSVSPMPANPTLAPAAFDRFVRKQPGPSLWQKFKDALTLPLMTPDRQIGWLPFAVRRGKRIIRRHKIGVLYSSGPPFTNHLVAYRLKRSTSRPWVADFRDPWVNADFRKARRTNAWVLRKHELWEKRVVELADATVVNTPRSRDDLLARYGDKWADRFIVIPNGFDPADFADDNTVHLRTSDSKKKLTIAHAGRFYGRRNVDGLIDAVSNLCRRGLVDRERIELRLIGALRASRDHEQNRIRRARLEGVVHLTPLLPHKECLAELSKADVLLLVQVGAQLSVPGKIFEYIGLGKPILALAHPGATTDLVEDEQLGFSVEPDNVPMIESTLLRLYEGFSRNEDFPQVRAGVHRRYDGAILTDHLDRVLRGVLKQR